MKTAAIKIETLFVVNEVLKQMIKRTGHGLGYEINLNLFKVSEAVKSWSKRRKDFHEASIEKDSEGDPIFFVSVDNKVLEMEGKETIVSSKKNASKLFPDKTVLDKVPTDCHPTAQTVNRYPSEDMKDIQEALKKFNDEEFKIDRIPFEKSQFKKAMKTESFDNIDMTSLFETGYLS